MQKIIPCVWFDHQAEEAATFYTALFPNSSVSKIAYYPKAGEGVSGKSAGSVMTVEFVLNGYTFLGLNGGPVFDITPAISFFVNLATEQEIDELWSKLSEGGTALMELGTYPFSQKYGWIQDKYGVSWQLILNDAPQKIVPSLLFVGEVYKKAEAAMQHYTSLLPDSKIIDIARYGESVPGEQADAVMYSSFSLANELFSAMDSGYAHAFTFTPAISFIINCDSQEEVDRLWTALSVVPEAEQCGWLQDAFGVSWQIVPTRLNELMSDGDQEKTERVMAAMLTMKKLDIAGLEAAAAEIKP